MGGCVRIMMVGVKAFARHLHLKMTRASAKVTLSDQPAIACLIDPRNHNQRNMVVNWAFIQVVQCLG